MATLASAGLPAGERPASATPRSAQKILTLAERAARKLPLWDPIDPDLEEHEGLAETRARNGSTAVSHGRRRTPCELALARSPRYKAREAARKRALRGNVPLRWLFAIPCGPTLEVLARTRSEAKALAKDALGLSRRTRLPRGVHADFLQVSQHG